MTSDFVTPISDASAQAAEQLAPGVTINETYLLLKVLGSGGKATVYLARDLILGEELAIKILHSHVVSDTSNYERFRREAKITARLQHKHIVRVQAFGMTLGTPFLVMEYVRGITLEKYIHSHGPIPLPQAMVMFRALAEALAYSHAEHVLHRDLKPANIMLEDDNPECPKLVDFGLARVSDSEGVNQQATTSAGIAGSPAYMSPEQCKGQTLDARSDLYSLAVTIFEAVTGKRLFNGETELAVMAMHLNDAPTFPHDEALPPEVQKLLLRCLSKNPLDRFQTATELLSQLTQLDTTRLRQWIAPIKSDKKQKRYFACLCAAGLIVAALTLWTFQHQHNERANSDSINPLKQKQQTPPAHTIGMNQRSPAGLAQAANRLFSKLEYKDSNGVVERMYLAALESAEHQNDWGVLARIEGMYANYLMATHQLAKANRYATKAIDTANIHQCGSTVKYETFRSAGRVFGANGKLEQAKISFQKAFDALQDELPGKAGYQKAVLLEDIAALYHDYHLPKEEMKALQAAISADPFDVTEYARRCLLLAQRAQDSDPDVFRRQIESYERVRYAPVKLTHVHLIAIAQRCYQKKELKEAIKYAQYALEDIRRAQDPTKLRNEYAKMLTLLVQTCAESNDMTAAAKYRDEALSKYRQYLTDKELEIIETRVDHFRKI